MEFTIVIREVLKSLNLTASEFADEVGIQKSSVSHLLAGRNKPSLQVLEKIAIRFPQISTGYLLTGNGSPISKEVQPTKQVSLDLEKEHINPQHPQEVDSVKKEVTEVNKVPLKAAETASKKLLKVLLCYTDGSVEEFNP